MTKKKSYIKKIFTLYLLIFLVEFYSTGFLFAVLIVAAMLGTTEALWQICIRMKLPDGINQDTLHIKNLK